MLPLPTCRIELLADHPEVRPVLKHWFEDEWSSWYRPGGPGNAEEDLQAYLRRDGLPLGLVAFRDNEACGFAALKAGSITSHAHLTPWAAAGLVPPRFRNQGIGSLLLGSLEEVARQQGYASLYCGTAMATGLLRRAGWRFMEQAMQITELVSIFEKSISTGQELQSGPTSK